MKSYSATAVTKTDVDALDAKQNKQLKLLSLAIVISFFANAALTLALFFH